MALLVESSVLSSLSIPHYVQVSDRDESVAGYHGGRLLLPRRSIGPDAGGGVSAACGGNAVRAAEIPGHAPPNGAGVEGPADDGGVSRAAAAAPLSGLRSSGRDLPLEIHSPNVRNLTDTTSHRWPNVSTMSPNGCKRVSAAHAHRTIRIRSRRQLPACKTCGRSLSMASSPNEPTTVPSKLRRGTPHNGLAMLLQLRVASYSCGARFG